MDILWYFLTLIVRVVKGAVESTELIVFGGALSVAFLSLTTWRIAKKAEGIWSTKRALLSVFIAVVVVLFPYAQYEMWRGEHEARLKAEANHPDQTESAVGATGTDRNTATPVNAHRNIVTKVPEGAGVVLPPSGKDIIILNRGKKRALSLSTSWRFD